LTLCHRVNLTSRLDHALIECSELSNGVRSRCFNREKGQPGRTA
jgi:hypothetical protein